MKKQLQEYYNWLDKDHKAYRKEYKKENPGRQGFQYNHNALEKEDVKWIKNVKEQKLHVKRLLKLIEEMEMM
jgi:hypothetical protein